MLLLPPEPDSVIAYLAEAVRSGGLPPGRVDDAARRVLEAKARAGLHRAKFVDPGSLAFSIGAPPAAERARRAFEAAVTLVKNEGPALPLPRGRADRSCCP
jgi:beta-glucosidase-like glycosyl hydrolase